MLPVRWIVGWVPFVNGDWHDAMSRMNQKLDNAYQIYPTKSWPARILGGKFRFAAKIACKLNHWLVLCSKCQRGYFCEKKIHVQPRKRAGQPPERWDDQPRAFSENVFHSSWTTAARQGAQWLSHEQGFVHFCSNPWRLNIELFSHVPRRPGHSCWLVREWMSACVSEWGSDWMSEWVSEWVSACVREWMGERVPEWVREWVRGWVREWVGEWVSEWVSEPPRTYRIGPPHFLWESNSFDCIAGTKVFLGEALYWCCRESQCVGSTLRFCRGHVLYIEWLDSNSRPNQTDLIQFAPAPGKGLPNGWGVYFFTILCTIHYSSSKP